jgi:ATP-binding cassette subfamily B protein
MRAVVGAYLRIVRLLPSAGHGLLAAVIAVNMLLGVLPITFIVATSVMIGRVPAAVDAGVGSDAWTALVTVFGLAAIGFVAQQILAPLQASLGELMSRRVDGLVYGRLIGASLRSTGIGPLEDQRLLNDLSEAARVLEFSFRTPGNACAGLLALVARYLQLLGCAAIVGIVFLWPAALALVLTTMLFRRGQRGGLRTYGTIFRQNIAERRETDYLRSTAMEGRAAKEIRVFGLAGWLSERYRRSYLRWLMPVWAERRRIYLRPYLLYTAVGLVVAGAIIVSLGQAAASRSIALTALALALQATLAGIGLGVFYAEADTQTEFGMIAYDGVVGFEHGVDAFHEQTVQLEPRQEPGGRPREAITFEAVTFRYPGSERAVLDGLELTIPAGRCTAIVGLNGAGKTTLIKLLARLHDPVDGRVLVDGVDLRAFGVDEWRRQIGIIFQDFNRYELSAAENIGFGSVELLGDRERIRDAARKAGVLSTLERLPLGLDTPLARQYRSGADLSGGQWQRVAIARALFALESGASILVLDEPTAALDVRAEAAFFDRFVDLTRGVTSILISHRFSSVRHADHIVMLEGGRIVEEGSHDELTVKGGRYAALFQLQAERFAEVEEPGESEDVSDLDPDGSASDLDPEAPASGR